MAKVTLLLQRFVSFLRWFWLIARRKAAELCGRLLKTLRLWRFSYASFPEAAKPAIPAFPPVEEVKPEPIFAMNLPSYTTDLPLQNLSTPVIDRTRLHSMGDLSTPSMSRNLVSSLHNPEYSASVSSLSNGHRRSRHKFGMISTASLDRRPPSHSPSPAPSRAVSIHQPSRAASMHRASPASSSIQLPSRSETPPAVTVVAPGEDSPTTERRLSLFRNSTQSRETPATSVSEQQLDSQLCVPSPSSNLGHGEIFSPLGDEDIIFHGNANLFPISPEIVNEMRYEVERRCKAPEGLLCAPFAALETQVTPYPQCDGWTRQILSDGSRYFYHPRWRLYTDYTMSDAGPMALDLVASCASSIHDSLARIRYDLKDIHIVLSVQSHWSDPDKYAGYYYLVNHATSRVFWLQEVGTEDIQIVSEVTYRRPTQINCISEYLYWYHCQGFPCSRPASYNQLDIERVRNSILHGRCDMLTTTLSNCPFSPEDCDSILSLLQHADPFSNSTDLRWCLARLLYQIVRAQVLNYHGEEWARIARNQTVHEPKPRRMTWLLFILRPILFTGPSIYMEKIEDIWCDDKIYIQSWKEGIEKLTAEWNDIIVLGTVLLAVNVSFLSIDSIEPSPKLQHDGAGRSIAQVLSYTSTIITMGSIVIGLLLKRLHHARAGETSIAAIEFIHSRKSEVLGMENIAIVYALPFSLLMWGMFLFLVGFTASCLFETLTWIRVVSASTTGIVVILIGWCFYVSYERGKEKKRTPVDNLWDTWKRYQSRSNSKATIAT
ncbi:hypothetical protein DL96DRAFT_1586724 [Flagelloscypha sp. PMI_526]|nr:hypothetical protein DL96DRAFT_1586724 [Flagelloscypha sp. PMI_526]